MSELEVVIRRGSSARRADTLRRIGALFADRASRLSDEHVQLFDEVLHRLIAEVAANARMELAHRLAAISNAPREVVRCLAKDDDIAVARPILMQSPRLADCDLLEVAEAKREAHLLALSKRRGLGKPLTDVLIRRGNREVLRSLADNFDAQLSDANFAALIDRAMQDGALAQRIGIRPDIPPRHLRTLVLASRPPMQQRLLARAKPEMQAEIRRILAQSTKEAQVKASQPDYATAERRILERRRGGNLDEASVVGLANTAQCDSDKYEELVAALALMCEVPIDVVDRLMASNRPDPVLILCKSVGWGWATARAIMTAMPAGQTMFRHDLDAAFDNFERLSRTTAQRVMRFWQVQFWQHTTADE
jgi:uncharacterized protein (DUF2336 family)